MSNEITDILKEIDDCAIEYADISKFKFKHHELSTIEPYMSSDDYRALYNDIVLCGKIHTPVIVYDNQILDGRHRQKACIELGLDLPIKVLTGTYDMSSLREVVRSLHMNRNKTKIQKDIQAFRYKQTVANITWEQASSRYGTKELSVKRINSFYNALLNNGYENDFNRVMSSFESGMAINPANYDWLTKNTSTFSGALKQLQEYVNRIEETVETIDITEFDPETGESLHKDNNAFMYTSDERISIKSLALKLENERSEKLALQSANYNLKQIIENQGREIKELRVMIDNISTQPLSD